MEKIMFKPSLLHALYAVTFKEVCLVERASLAVLRERLF